MKHLFKIYPLLIAMILQVSYASAQIKDGEATVVQGSTTTVSIGSAYASTLNLASSVSATWTTSGSAISIQSRTNTTCTIKGNTAGTAKLYYQCTYYIDGYRRTMNFYYDITIKSNTVSVTRIEVTPSSATMEIGETLQLNATVYPVNATNRSVNWTTEDYSIASVSSSGLVTARGTGKVWAWARATDGSGAGNYCVITVNEPEPKWLSVVLPNGSFAINATDMTKIELKITPDEGYSIHSITIDDEEQTVESSETVLTLPALEHSSTVNAVFISTNPSGIENASESTESPHVTVSGKTIHVSNLPQGETVNVYNQNGVLVKVTSDDTFSLDKNGIYILQTAGKVFKLAI